ncbi:MAG: hypothetical protein LBU87_01720 [Lactobacillales bacterium]|nr:hypothetical protein [Lactobacillales bacterium]
MRARQLPLNLSYRPAFGREDFIVSPSNTEAVSWIDNYKKWPMHALVICGEKGSGKTHLASIFAPDQIDAKALGEDFSDLPERIVVENLEGLSDEKALFHLFNRVKEKGGYLLLTASTMPDFKLPDLKTRIGAIPKAFISKPDDELLFGVLSKAFYERQITVGPAVLEYIVTHTERTFGAIQKVIQKADMLSLSKGGKITVPLIKEVLGKGL